MNYIIFNHDGSIKNVNFAEIIVQGNNLVDEIFVAVEGRSTDSYLATAYFELPNGESNFLTATPYSHSIDQSPYNGYKFLLTGAQTAFYGRVRMSLKLEGMQGETLWTYEQVLTINKSGYNPDFTMITMSQYAALVQAMGSLQEKFVVNNARFYSSLANAQADLDNLAFNQCVIIADTTATDPIPEIYFKNAESQLELLAGIGEYTFQAGTTTTQTLSPGSDATVSVSFVASGKTITMNFTFGIPRGNTGATGNGIASIEKYSTEGQVDTYRITYTNGSHFDFDVTNGTLAGHLLSTTFEYDDERPLDSLSMQLAAEIRRLVDADGSKVKSITASKPTSNGGVQTYSIVWDYNVNIIPGALNVEDGDFYFENDGVLTSIDSHLEDYTFSIFHEVEGTGVDDFGYVEIDDTAKVGSGTLTQAELVELRKPISFIRYKTGIRSYDMLISYYSARQANHTTSKYFRGFMHKGSEDFDSAYAYNLSRSFITVTNLDSTTTGGWSYTLNVDAYVDKVPTENSTNLVTSGGVHSAVSTLDSKISKNAEDIATLTEALIKKDLYETQEATFQGMTPVPAGAMVKAYLDGFKGNSAVVNQLSNRRTISGSTSSTEWQQVTDHYYNVIKSSRSYLICITVSKSANANVRMRFPYLTDNLTAGKNYILVATPNLETIFYQIQSTDGNEATCTLTDEMVIDLSIVPLTTAEMASVSTVKAALKPKGMNVDSYIPFTAATLTDSKPTKLISRGYNLFDEEYLVGYYDGSTGVYVSASGQLCSKNYIKVFGGQSYTCDLGNNSTYWRVCWYDKNHGFISSTAQSGGASVQAPSNAWFAQFGFGSVYGGTYHNDVCFHLSSVNLGYKPHVPPIEYNLTLPTLKSAGSVQDEVVSDEFTRNLTQSDMGELNWSEYSGGGFVVLAFGAKYIGSSSAKSNILSSKYPTVGLTSMGDGDKCIAILGNGNLWLKDSSLTISTISAALSGQKINWEQANPVVTRDQYFQEIFNVYAGGSIEVVGDGCDATTKVYFYVEA